jgi:hypothetical protein
VNYSGYDMYAHNRATRHYGVPSRELLPVTMTVQCPFCLADVLMVDGRIKMHLEWRGFTVCPVSGFSLELAQAQAQSLMDGGE